MVRQTAIAFALLGLLAGCVEPRPSGVDMTPPRITLTLLDGTGTPRFDTDEENQNPADACGTARAFPATVSVAVGDPGGVRQVLIRLFPAALVRDSISVGPAAPATSHEVTRDGAADRLVITSEPPGPDLVRTGLVAIFDVSDLTAITVAALDASGNSNNLYQVDIRPPDDAVICRNDRI
jgi:hypothetical protein